MARDPGEELYRMNRTLHGIESSLSDIANALKALNYNYVEINCRPGDVVTKEDDGAGNSGSNSKP